MDTTYFVELEEFVCPAEFWPALGYEGEARYVAIYWEQCGDEAAWADGRQAFAGAHWPSYLALLRHNFSPQHPYHYLLGASDATAVFWLVIDRDAERAWLAPAELAEKRLLDQWPTQLAWGAADVADDGCGVVDFEEIVRRIANMPAAPLMSLEEIQQQLDDDVARHEALVAALAARPAKWQRVRQNIDEWSARYETRKEN